MPQVSLVSYSEGIAKMSESSCKYPRLDRDESADSGFSMSITGIESSDISGERNLTQSSGRTSSQDSEMYIEDDESAVLEFDQECNAAADLKKEIRNELFSLVDSKKNVVSALEEISKKYDLQLSELVGFNMDDDGNKFLHIIAERRCILNLIEKIWDKDVNRICDIKNDNGDTIVHRAMKPLPLKWIATKAFQGERSLSDQTNIFETQNSDQDTAIHCLVRTGRVDLLGLILDACRQADGTIHDKMRSIFLNSLNSKGQSPVRIATENKKLDNPALIYGSLQILDFLYSNFDIDAFADLDLSSPSVTDSVKKWMNIDRYATDDSKSEEKIIVSLDRIMKLQRNNLQNFESGLEMIVEKAIFQDHLDVLRWLYKSHKQILSRTFLQILRCNNICKSSDKSCEDECQRSKTGIPRLFQEWHNLSCAIDRYGSPDIDAVKRILDIGTPIYHAYPLPSSGKFLISVDFETFLDRFELSLGHLAHSPHLGSLLEALADFSPDPSSSGSRPDLLQSLPFKLSKHGKGVLHLLAQVASHEGISTLAALMNRGAIDPAAHFQFLETECDGLNFLHFYCKADRIAEDDRFLQQVSALWPPERFEDMLVRLHKLNMDRRWSPADFAAQAGNLPALQFLVARCGKAILCGSSEYFRSFPARSTALHVAAGAGRKSCLSILIGLDASAVLGARDGDGCTCIHAAAASRKSESLSALVNHLREFPPLTQDWEVNVHGYTPAHLVLKDLDKLDDRSHFDAVERCVAVLADSPLTRRHFDSLDQKGQSPITLLCEAFTRAQNRAHGAGQVVEGRDRAIGKVHAIASVARRVLEYGLDLPPTALQAVFNYAVLDSGHVHWRELPTIRVDRKRLLRSSMAAVEAVPAHALSRGFRIGFLGEAGVDGGGLSLDWLSELGQRLLGASEYIGIIIPGGDGYVTVSPRPYIRVTSEANENLSDPATSDASPVGNSGGACEPEDPLAWFRFCGMLLGLAVVKRTCFRSQLASGICKQLLGQGVCWEDLAQSEPELYGTFRCLSQQEPKEVQEAIKMLKDQGEYLKLPSTGIGAAVQARAERVRGRISNSPADAAIADAAATRKDIEDAVNAAAVRPVEPGRQFSDVTGFYEQLTPETAGSFLERLAQKVLSPCLNGGCYSENAALV